MQILSKKRATSHVFGAAAVAAALALCALACAAFAWPAGAAQQGAENAGAGAQDAGMQEQAAGGERAVQETGIASDAAVPAGDDAFLTVYEQYGVNGKLVERRSYPVEEFEAMGVENRDPVSGMYYKNGAWWATSSDYYVTLAELLQDAGLDEQWQDKATLLYGATGTSGLSSVAYSTFKQQCFFYPEATGSILGGTTNPVTVEPVLSVTEYSDPLSTTMADLEESNLRNANYKYEPQLIWGITKNGYKTAGYSSDPVDNVSGARYLHNVNAIVVRNNIEIAGGVESSYTYAGEPICPKPQVVYGAVTLEEGKDYSLSYKNNDTAGTATVTVTPIGDYAGAMPATVEKKFEIGYGDFTKAQIAPIPDQTWTGAKLKPALQVSFEGKALEKEKDYVAVYENNVNEGTATVTVAGFNNFAGEQTVHFNIVKPGDTPTPAPTPATSVWKRLAGQTAIGTMKAIVNEGWKESEWAIVATTNGYYDALSASGLAGLLDCPVLMTAPDKFTSATKELIQSKKVKHVIVVGGTSAVSDAVVNQIGALDGVADVERVAGGTAIGTANAIYKRGKTAGEGWGSDAIVATAGGFQDALSIAPYAYAKAAPIFLAGGKPGTLSDKTRAKVLAGGFTRTIIVGGSSAVAQSVQDVQLAGMACERLGGNTAYGTSNKIAAFCLKNGMTARHMGVATGRGYQDALAGAALCGAKGSVIILADDGNSNNVAKVVGSNKSALQESCYVFGGEKAVSKAVYSAIEKSSK